MKRAIGTFQYDIKRQKNYLKFVCPQCGRTNRHDEGIFPWPLPKQTKCDYCNIEVKVAEK